MQRDIDSTRIANKSQKPLQQDEDMFEAVEAATRARMKACCQHPSLACQEHHTKFYWCRRIGESCRTGIPTT